MEAFNVAEVSKWQNASLKTWKQRFSFPMMTFYHQTSSLFGGGKLSFAVSKSLFAATKLSFAGSKR